MNQQIAGGGVAPVMIMVAPNGARVQRKDNPAVPITPREIADDVVRCADAGASIAHIHARQPDGEPTQSLEVFREIVDRIRERCDIILQISLGTRGLTVEQAIEPVALRPEMVSLPLEVFHSEDHAAHDGVRRMAKHIREHGVRPELSIYDDRMLQGALSLVREGAIQAPAFFGLVVKDPPSMKEGAAKLAKLADDLPTGSHWWMLNGGQFIFELRAFAISLGGHVRIGFEDTARNYSESSLAPSNAYLVERAVNLCCALGRRIAVPADVRLALSATTGV